ncbi:hypothetical protein KP509_28G034800 [Ceratopteris richardii]|uniref:Uncharacterized protein n=1 Tax=Ceratopteris richardii TaxID=49495 RepID=A0A8T2RB01_CERRI|nr:hypothetical protein KP509_28G034800 [Ceratopteris richardii]
MRILCDSRLDFYCPVSDKRQIFEINTTCRIRTERKVRERERERDSPPTLGRPVASQRVYSCKSAALSLKSRKGEIGPPQSSAYYYHFNLLVNSLSSLL